MLYNTFYMFSIVVYVFLLVFCLICIGNVTQYNVTRLYYCISFFLLLLCCLFWHLCATGDTIEDSLNDKLGTDKEGSEDQPG